MDSIADAAPGVRAQLAAAMRALRGVTEDGVERFAARIAQLEATATEQDAGVWGGRAIWGPRGHGGVRVV